MTITNNESSLVVLYKGVTMVTKEMDLLLADANMLSQYEQSEFYGSEAEAEKYKPYIANVHVVEESYLTTHIYQDPTDGQVHMILHIVPPTAKKQLSYEGLQVRCKKGIPQKQTVQSNERFGLIRYGASYQTFPLDSSIEVFGVIKSVENEHVVTLSFDKQVNTPVELRKLRQLFKI